MPLPAGFSVRPAAPDDVDFWCRVLSTDPRLAWDPVKVRDSWDKPQPGVQRERSLILEGGIPVGILRIWTAPPARGGPRFVDLAAGFLEGEERADLRDAAWDLAEDRARELGAEVMTTRCLDHETVQREYVATRGYLLDRAGIISGLRIGDQRERFQTLAAKSAASMREAGVELTTLDRLPDAHPALYEVMVEAESDIPNTIPIVSDTFEVFVDGLRKPWTGEHRVWVALAEGRPVGLSYLAYHPVTGNVFTELTGVARSHRGRGIARALKLQTIAQALDAGVDHLYTENDAENEAILRINRSFGYEPVRQALLFRKAV